MRGAIFKAIVRILRPSVSPCSLCAKHVHRHVTETQLGRKHLALGRMMCAACAKRIPWVETIACVHCGKSTACADCLRRPLSPLHRNRSAVRYEASMRQWLAQFKYRGDEKLAPLFGHMMHHTLDADLPGPSSKTKERPTVLTAVPLSTQRQFERGFNQAYLLAVHLAKTHTMPHMPLLQRIYDTPKQSSLSRQQRWTMLQHSFAIAPHAWVAFGAWVTTQRLDIPIRIVLVDDVYTTGSTLHHCATTIQQAIDRCSFAHSYTFEIEAVTWAR